MTTPPTQPEKSIFILFKEAASLFFKSGKFLFVMTLLTYVPVYIFRQFLPKEYLEAIQEFFAVALDHLASAEVVDIGVLTAALNENAIMYAIMFLGIELVFFPLIAGAATYLAAQNIKEESPSFDSMFSAVLPRFPKMIFTTLLVSFVLFGMLYFFQTSIFIIFPIYFGITLIFFQNITADLGRWGFSAMSISRFMVRGRWFRSFFMFCAIGIAYFAVSAATDILGFNFGVTASPLIHLPYFLLQHFVLSYFVLVFALWYFDIKRFQLQNLEELEKMLFQKMSEHIKDLIFDDKDEEDEEEKEAEPRPRPEPEPKPEGGGENSS